MKCLFCKSENVKKKYFLKEHDALFFQCKDCKLIWLDKNKWPKDQEEHYSNVYYDKEYSGRVNLDEAFSYRFPLIDKYAPRKVLEVGAASGDFLNILKNKGYDVYGVELSKRAVEVAKKNYGIDIFCGTLEKASFEDNSFDLVVLYHVLEHIPDPKIFLIELARILKFDGVAIIEIPNPDSIDSWSYKLLGSVLDYPHHLYAYPEKFLRRITKETGFSVCHIEHSFSYLLASLRRKRVKKSAGGGGKSSGNGNIKKGMFLKRIFPGMKMTIVLKKL